MIIACLPFFLHCRLWFMSYEESLSELNIQVSLKKVDGCCREMAIVER